MEENNFKAKGQGREQALAFFSPFFSEDSECFLGEAVRKDMSWKLKSRVAKGIFELTAFHREKGSLCLADILNLYDSLLVLILLESQLEERAFQK